MDYDDHVDVVELETRMLISAFRDAPRGARVPTCPDFAVSDLAAHVGEFTALWTHVLCDAADTEKTPYAPLDDDEDMGAWYEPLAHHLLGRLRATSGDAPCWMWIPDQQTAGSVARRCANELSIHRFDAQSAGANPTPLDTAAALDAIDEIFVMLPVWDNPPEGSRNTLGLCATEGAQRTITLGPCTDGIEAKHACRCWHRWPRRAWWHATSVGVEGHPDHVGKHHPFGAVHKP